MCWSMVLGARDNRAQSKKGQSSVLKELRFHANNLWMQKWISREMKRKEGGKKERQKERISLWGFVSGWIIKPSNVMHSGRGYFILFYFPGCEPYRILVSWPGIEPMPFAVEAWSPNHWTTGEFAEDILYLCVQDTARGLRGWDREWEKPAESRRVSWTSTEFICIMSWGV